MIGHLLVRKPAIRFLSQSCETLPRLCGYDQHLPEAEAATSGTAHLNDVSCYDLTWALNVVRRSWQGLHEAFAAEGKGKLLEELKPFVAGGMVTPPNQEDVAARLGVPIATLAHGFPDFGNNTAILCASRSHAPFLIR